MPAADPPPRSACLLHAALEFVCSAVVVVIAGTLLTRAADRIADLSGLGGLLIGSVLLAAATSLPELCVDVNAAWRGLDDLAAGDLMGSSLANLTILAVADLMHRSRGRLLSRASAAHALSGAMSVLLTGLTGVMIVGRFGASVGGVGLGSLIVCGVYALGVRIVYYDQRLARARAEEATDGRQGGSRAARAALVRPVLIFAVAAVAIVAAAPFVARSAGEIADLSGLGTTFVGTTLVGFSTSLPELVATIASVRLRAFDLAVGNILGSNAFNMAMLLPVDLVSEGPLLSMVSPVHALTCLWVVVITSVTIVGQLYHAERRSRLVEPDALLVIALVITALVTIYFA